MLKKWISMFRKWTARVIAPIARRLIEPAENREFAVLDDYLRVQNLRRLEEERFRRAYWGAPRL